MQYKTHLPTLVDVTEGDIDTAVVMNIEVEVVTVVIENSTGTLQCLSTH